MSKRAHVSRHPVGGDGDIRWEEMESLLRVCGVEVVERPGASVGLSKGSERIVMHRPCLRPIIGPGGAT